VLDLARELGHCVGIDNSRWTIPRDALSAKPPRGLTIARQSRRFDRSRIVDGHAGESAVPAGGLNITERDYPYRLRRFNFISAQRK